jgi:hypothetical protein
MASTPASGRIGGWLSHILVQFDTVSKPAEELCILPDSWSHGPAEAVIWLGADS